MASIDPEEEAARALELLTEEAALLEDMPDANKLISDARRSGWLDGWMAARYLRARPKSSREAAVMLVETLRWREDFRPCSTRYIDIHEVASLASLYPFGRDRDGRPVVYIQPGARNPYDVEQRIRFLVYVMEWCCRVCPPHLGSFVWIMDFKMFGQRVSSPENRQVAIDSLRILQDNYPERLHRAVLVNPPWYFTPLKMVLWAFMSSETHAKIKIISGDTAALHSALGEWIEDAQLPVEYGGDCEVDVAAELAAMDDTVTKADGREGERAVEAEEAEEAEEVEKPEEELAAKEEAGKASVAKED
eukprot:PLAT14780.2.p1 GENE.PLAT14780.2~~PLAT14780.2.p1  ORF type:complete len:314 (+),score=84.07 PLAT14780.2:28-942(+)